MLPITIREQPNMLLTVMQGDFIENNLDEDETCNLVRELLDQSFADES